MKRELTVKCVSIGLAAVFALAGLVVGLLAIPKLGDADRYGAQHAAACQTFADRSDDLVRLGARGVDTATQVIRAQRAGDVRRLEQLLALAEGLDAQADEAQRAYDAARALCLNP